MDMKQLLGSFSEEDRKFLLGELSKSETKEPSKEEPTGKPDEAASDKMVEESVKELVNSVKETISKSIVQPKEEKTIVNNQDAKDELTEKQKVLYEWGKALMTGDRQRMKDLATTPDSAGGYLVDSVVYGEVVNRAQQYAKVSPYVTKVPAQQGQGALKIDRNIGAPIVKWVGEGASKSATTVDFGQVSLDPLTVACLVPITNQLIRKSKIDIVNYVIDVVTQALVNEENRALSVGNGTTQPAGFSTAGFTGDVNAGFALSTAHLVQVIGRLPEEFRLNAKWFMNSRDLTHIYNLTDSNNRPIVVLDQQESLKPFVYGKEVVTIDHLPSASIWFGDLKGYYLYFVPGIRVDVADQASWDEQGVQHHAFQENKVLIRVEQDYDGDMVNLNAMKEITNTGVS